MKTKIEFAIISGSSIYFLCQIKNATTTICQSACVLSVKATSFGYRSRKKRWKIGQFTMICCIFRTNFNAMKLKLIISCLVIFSYNNWRYNRGNKKKTPDKKHLLRLLDAKCRVNLLKGTNVYYELRGLYFSIYLRIYIFRILLNIYISLAMTATIATCIIEHVTYLCIR